jgi:hypothetical protein
MERETIHHLLLFLKIGAGLFGTIMLALEVKKAQWGEGFNIVKEHLNQTDEKGKKEKLKTFYTTLLIAIYQGKINAWIKEDSKNKRSIEDIKNKSKEFANSAQEEVKKIIKEEELKAIPVKKLLDRRSYLKIGFWFVAASFLLELIDFLLMDFILK